MFTYYEVLQTSGAAKGAPEVNALNSAPLLTRILADFRFLLQQIGTRPALVQIEPDFWAYAQRINPNPHLIAASVPSANPTDCGSQEASIAGFGRCLIAMTRKYAPAAKIGLHASGFATGVDVLLNKDVTLDVAAEGAKVGAFLAACGAADGDFVTVDSSDRDAGFYASQGRATTWDASNAQLPNFRQAFRWSKAVAETLGLPVLWWQLPVGNAAQTNQPNHWQDNRVDYFFAHTDELATAHAAGMLFGGGAAGQTTPETDGGNLRNKAQAYATSGGQRLCP